jgi:hypothetical protein
VKRFDFSRADVDGICAQLVAVDWCALFPDLGIDDCVEKFYIIARERFDRFVPFYTTVLTRRTGNPGLIKSFVI